MVIHYKGKDGLTLIDHHKILNQVEGYSLINLETLLTLHWFLFDTDFEKLGSGPTSHRLSWLADIDTAVPTLQLAHLGTLTSEALTYFLATHPTCVSGAVPDEELEA